MRDNINHEVSVKRKMQKVVTPLVGERYFTKINRRWIRVTVRAFEGLRVSTNEGYLVHITELYVELT